MTAGDLQGNLEVRQYLYSIAETMLCEFMEEDSKELVQMVPCGLKSRHQNMPKEYYDQTIRIPFENTTIPVPYMYEEILTRRYGDYMKLVKSTGGHDYPFFGIQQKEMEEILNFGFQRYLYQPDHTEYRKYNAENVVNIKEGSYKIILREGTNELVDLYQNYLLTRDVSVLTEFQQLAIDMGTMIEKVKGEGTECVKMLEKICESAYLLFQGESKHSLEGELQEFKKLLETEVLCRKEIVFISFNANYWEHMQRLYEEEKSAPFCDVFVLPIPTYRKTYDMQLIEEEYHPELYPDDIAIWDYRKFDFALHYPEKIYIESPYDEYNPTWSVHPFFYSSNLIKYTDELTYIPWFETEDFTATNEREYQNMQYYVTMPGVCYSDCVILSSKETANVYIQKLTEWAGAETKNIWEQKIIVRELKHVLSKNTTVNGTKHLLYYIGTGPLLAHKTQMLKKIKNTCGIFNQYREQVSYIYMTEPGLEETVSKIDPFFYQEYTDVTGKLPRTDLNIEEFMERCDAYYGSASYIANMFRDSGKPVMIQDVQII